MNKWLIVAAVVALGFNVQAKVMESSVATVNGRPILASEYDAYLEAVVEQYQVAAPELLQQPYAKDRIGHEVIKKLISEELLHQAAEEAKVVVKDSEVDEGINEIKTRFIIDEKTGKEDPKNADKRFNEALKKQGMTLKRYKEKIKKDVAVRKLMEEKMKASVKPVEEEDAKALFDNVEIVLKNNTKKIKALEKQDPLALKEAQAIAAQLKQLTGEQVRIGHIYIALTKDMTPEQRQEKEALAKQIKKELDGGLDFSSAVQKYTEDKASLASGGDMILIKGIAPKEIDKEAFTLAVGKISAPIKTDIGYHIIKIKEKKAERTVTYEDIRNDLGNYIAQKRVQKALADYMEELYEKADVKVTKTFELDKLIEEQAKEKQAAETAKAEKTDKAETKK